MLNAHMILNGLMVKLTVMIGNQAQKIKIVELDIMAHVALN